MLNALVRLKELIALLAPKGFKVPITVLDALKLPKRLKGPKALRVLDG